MMSHCQSILYALDFGCMDCLYNFSNNVNKPDNVGWTSLHFVAKDGEEYPRTKGRHEIADLIEQYEFPLVKEPDCL